MARAKLVSMPMATTLRDAAKRAREVALHFDRAAAELELDVVPVALDRMETHCCHAHHKTGLLKQAATRSLRVIASLRKGFDQ